ncbi:hypothetical protein JCM10213_000086 [Rhodosporidiobolus nylandii]
MHSSRTALRRHTASVHAIQPPRTLSAPPLLSLNSRPRWGISERRTAQGAVLGGQRGFFGVGEIIGVLTNPTEVLRNLADSKRLLEEARKELTEAREKSQIPAAHTFAPLPGFFDRPNEIKAIERALGSVPGFTVLFGASSVGKTALLRQVLASDKYHVLHFDLRIAGFADLSSLYFSLSTQLESYFASIPDLLGKEFGWGEFEKESWAFKHDRISVEKRVANGGEVKTSDLAHLLELFQSALLSYWNFQPMTEAQRKRAERLKEEEEKEKAEAKSSGSATSTSSTSADASSSTSTIHAAPGPDPVLTASHAANDPTEARMRQGAVPVPQPAHQPGDSIFDARSPREKIEDQRRAEKAAKVKAGEEEEDEVEPPPKKIPVWFLDEAHKLPALIEDYPTMKAFLDAMLVLTKQDRLCHVIHATSDPFLMHFLRQTNIMQHCQILSIGDCSKVEAARYFKDVLIPHIPEKLRGRINFEDIYKVFGGKLAHLADYVGEFINNDGELPAEQSSHFLQAHSLLNLQLIHSTPPRSTSDDDEAAALGFRIYSPLAGASPHAGAPTNDAGPDFTPTQLLSIFRRLQPGAEEELPYFALCRELGARAVDGAIRGRILELRWSRAVTDEGDVEDRRRRKEKELREGVKKEKSIGPVVVPTTPVVRWAMGLVLQEYEGEKEGAKRKMTAKDHPPPEGEEKAGKSEPQKGEDES